MSEDTPSIAGIVGGEVWRPIAGFEGAYEVSSLGRIKSLARTVTTSGKVRRRWIVPERILSLGKTRKGYLSINLNKNGRAYPREVHRLVCEAFHGQCPDGMEAAHEDGNPANAAASNLAWKTRKANHADKLVHGTHPIGEDVSNAKLTAAQAVEICRRALSGEGRRAVGREFSVTDRTIRNIVNGLRWERETAAVRTALQEQSK